LKAIGNDPGPIDGRMGPKTRAGAEAVSGGQRFEGYPAVARGHRNEGYDEREQRAHEQRIDDQREEAITHLQKWEEDETAKGIFGTKRRETIWQ